VLAASLVSGYNTVPAQGERNQETPFATLYRTNDAPQSFSQLRSIFGSILNHETDQLAESISIFYEKLVASQESLGAEFSSILHENLWDLYAR
jgi:hypothetical protein